MPDRVIPWLISMIFALIPIALSSTTASAQGSSGASSAAAVPGESPALNPAISVIGWIQVSGGNDPRLAEDAVEVTEVEVAFQKTVDPSLRADFFLAIGPEELEIEEAYLTTRSLPAGLNLRFGKLRSDFSRFNRVHPPETAFADRPLVSARAWGEEGLTTVGGSLNYILPGGDRFFWDVTGEIGMPPELKGEETEEPGAGEDAGAMGLISRDGRDEFLYLLRSSSFFDLSDATSLTLGITGVSGPAAADLAVSGSRVDVAGVDIGLKWKNPRRSIYRSFELQAQGLWAWDSRGGDLIGAGSYAYAIYQFARRTRVGLRLDWNDLTAGGGSESGVLALITFNPSEFSSISLQGRRIWNEGESTSNAVFLKTTFTIGSHGVHPL